MKIFKKLRLYLRLIRPKAWFPFWFGLLYGLIDAGFQPLSRVFILFLTWGIFLPGFIYAVNFYSDKDLDRKGHGRKKDIIMSKQPFATGEIGRIEGLFLMIFLLAAGNVASYFLFNTTVFILTLIISLLGIVYSLPPRLKSIPFADIFVNAAGLTVCYMIGWSVLADFRDLPIFPPYLIFFGTGGLYLLTVIGDMENDRKFGLQTTAVFIGLKKTLYLSAFLLTTGVLFYALNLFYHPALNYFIFLPLMIKGLLSFSQRVKRKNVSYIQNFIEKTVRHEIALFFILFFLYVLIAIMR